MAPFSSREEKTSNNDVPMGKAHRLRAVNCYLVLGIDSGQEHPLASPGVDELIAWCMKS